MATNFPGSQDTFTNPTSGSSLSSPSHADQHTNVNDAIEAIETALLDGAPLKIDDANQRVGIGTTSPSTALEVSSNTGGGTTSTDLRISSTGQSSTWSTSNAWGVLDFYNADGSGGGAKSHVSLQAVAGEPLGQYSDLQFHVTDGSASDITAMTIEGSSGNVGINDSTPSYKLDVNGDINTTGYVNVEGDKLGMAFLGSGGLGGGTTDFTGYFTTKWRNYRVIVDPSWNGSSVFTYMQFLDTSNNPITSGYYSAGINNGTFARWNNQSGQLCYDSSYIGRGGAIIDILGTHADYPAFHITSTAYQTSGVTYDNRISGFLNHSQDVTGLRFYNGAPYGAVYFYGYG